MTVTMISGNKPVTEVKYVDFIVHKDELTTWSKDELAYYVMEFKKRNRIPEDAELHETQDFKSELVNYKWVWYETIFI